MRFDTNTFKVLFAQYLAEYYLESMGLWALADSVFVTEVKEKSGSGAGFVFVHDISRVHFRDIDRMYDEVQVYAIDTEYDEVVQCNDEVIPGMLFWGVDTARCLSLSMGCRFDAITRLLVSSDGSEVDWYETPRQIK